MNLLMKRLDPKAYDLVVAYPGDAGIDLPVLESVVVMPGEHMDVRTGWAAAIPVGNYGRIVGRSSAFRKKGVIVLEGVIDAGFRGELFTSAYNPGFEPVLIEAGERVGQLIVSPIPYVIPSEVDELPQSERGERGFGSSGR